MLVTGGWPDDVGFGLVFFGLADSPQASRAEI